jgi:hypothetical protein
MKSIALCVAAVLSVPALALAVDKSKVAYVGGTLDNIKEKSEGRVQTTGESFIWYEEKTGRTLKIPYSTFVEVEYGSRAGRRVQVDTQAGRVSRLRKTQHHYVTITYVDARSKEQVAVFEFGKDIVDHELRIIQGRSRKDITRLQEEPEASPAK